ncbi:unnamed protein product [Caenorhabditis sp. 36 PRJEB53466]|nr:unnamed protein product [Caenorhabditis sp. 36 PRJEB53466]
MSEEEIKSGERIEMQGEIIEDVIEQEAIEVEQCEWMGEGVVLEDQGAPAYFNELIDHQMVEFDESDQFQALLPVRNGVPVLSLNLPDLLSKPINFSENERMIMCFNKKCQRQLAFAGFLYTIKDYVLETEWNNWRCVNSHCFGEIRTTPSLSEVRICHEHARGCPQDDLQIRIRIAVYDARLMAEFTDAPLETLYAGAQGRIKEDFPDASCLLPSFQNLKSTLEDHRINKIYRKRFEMQNLRDKQKKMGMTPDEVVFTENASGLIKFRRTKPFPPSMCSECNEQLISNSMPSQDNLIAHYMYNHGRRMTIERFEFKDVNLFDQYLRELNLLSRHKLKRMGLADENMYYLCTQDDRLAKTGVGRATRMQEQNCHCTAFIRVFDWRIVSKQEGSRITIDYCLEHQQHPQEPSSPNPSKEEYDYYTPEVFICDIEERRRRTVKLLGDVDSGKKRTLEPRTYVPPGRARPCFGTRALAPPLAAQLAAGTTSPFVDLYAEQSSINSRPRPKFRQNIRTAYPKVEEEPSTSSSTATTSTVPPPRIYISQKPYSRLTKRQHFKDIHTFNAVCKVEDTCLNLLNRLQSCQSARVGLAYREKVNALLRQANVDPALSDGASLEDTEKSWVHQKPLRGRPSKKRKLEEGEEDGESGEDEEDEDVDVEIEKMTEEEEEEAGGNDTTITTEEDEERSKEEHKSSKIEPNTREDVPKKVHAKRDRKEEPPHLQQTDSTTRSGRQRKVPARLAQ